MTKTEVLKALKAAGTAQNRKIYARHGVPRDMFGVSYAELGRLQKKIKRDQPLAEALWATGNHDAMVLATMIADPDALKASTLDAWAKDLDSYPLADSLASLTARSPLAAQRARKWCRSRDEWIGSAGWSIVAHLALSREQFEEKELAELLDTVEKKIHGAKNRTRYSMNNALISIGTYNAKLKAKAVAAAKRIGPVEVDHGETGCKTPDAVSYIPKAFARSEARAKKKPVRRASRAGTARA